MALTPELTSWFSGLSLAGFEVTLYGRIWVTPEGLPASFCAALFDTRTYCTRAGVVLLARWDGTIDGRWSMVFSGARAS